MLEARRLECVRGERRLFSEMSFSLHPNDCIEVRGPNGSGKTSLLRVLCGLLPPASGAVLWRGESIRSNRQAFLSDVTYVGHRAAVKEELTVMENLRVSSSLSGVVLSVPDASEALDRVGLGSQRDRQARYLSEGQRRRIALARLFACQRSLWLLDEILTSLDENASHVVRSAFDSHLARGGMAVVATHQDLALAAGTARIELLP
jgi:heme exporter protein A